jgi:MFS family permease
MSTPATADAPIPERANARKSTWYLAGYVYFTFICYVSIGLPLAVLPPFVHLKMGYSAVLAGLAISVQYAATLASRPWAGRISDHMGAKVSVLWGMACCSASGALLVGVALLHDMRGLSLAILFLSRLVLGVGESLGSTGSTLWGITAVGQEHTARVIGLNGISTYGAMAIAAPLGVVLAQQWGLASIGVLTILIGTASFAIAWRKAPVPVVPGEHMPFAHVAWRVAPHGLGLALGGVSYSVLATFITLFYAHLHWNGAALCLTAYGLGYVAVRIFLIHTIDRYGGFPVAMASLAVNSVGVFLLWQALFPWMAVLGAAVCGIGFSLTFPAIGVEAVKRVPEANRGTALGVYTAFSDVSFFLVGPIAGKIIGFFGYASAFLFALVSVLSALCIVVVLRQFQGE